MIKFNSWSRIGGSSPLSPRFPSFEARCCPNNRSLGIYVTSDPFHHPPSLLEFLPENLWSVNRWTDADTFLEREFRRGIKGTDRGFQKWIYVTRVLRSWFVCEVGKVNFLEGGEVFSI